MLAMPCGMAVRGRDKAEQLQERAMPAKYLQC